MAASEAVPPGRRRPSGPGKLRRSNVSWHVSFTMGWVNSHTGTGCAEARLDPVGRLHGKGDDVGPGALQPPVRRLTRVRGHSMTPLPATGLKPADASRDYNAKVGVWEPDLARQVAEKLASDRRPRRAGFGSRRRDAAACLCLAGPEGRRHIGRFRRRARQRPPEAAAFRAARRRNPEGCGQVGVTERPAGRCARRASMPS